MAPKQEVALPHWEEEEEKDQLPMGFHFSPTDEELIVHFLIPKILGTQFPNNLMEDFDDDIYTSDPKEILFSQCEDQLQKFFFSKHVFIMGSTPHWKEFKDQVEVRNKTNEIVGYKKTLIYHKDDKDEKLTWKMYEYRASPNFMMNPAADDAKKYVACRLKFKDTTHHFKIQVSSDHSSSTDASGEEERETSNDQPKKKMKLSMSTSF